MSGGRGLLLALTLGLLSFACSDRPVGASRDGVADVHLTTTEGETLRLGDLRGRAVLLVFWSTTCPACYDEVPRLVDLHREFERRGLTLIGIAMPHDRPDRILEFQADRQIPYTLAFDPTGELNRQFDTGQVTPTHLLISPQGEIVLRHQGPLDDERVERTIRSMLQV